jgi:hypothetical protein
MKKHHIKHLTQINSRTELNRRVILRSAVMAVAKHTLQQTCCTSRRFDP